MRPRVSPGRTPALGDHQYRTRKQKNDSNLGGFFYGWKIKKAWLSGFGIEDPSSGGPLQASGPVPGVCMVRKVKCRTSMGKSQGPIPHGNSNDSHETLQAEGARAEKLEV